MRKRTSLVVLALVFGACATSSTKAPPMANSPTPEASSNDHISVDHILIGVKSSRFPPGKRNEADARTFAHDLYAKLKAGGDWDAAKRANSEDPPPGGPYGLANRGVAPAGRGEYARGAMVPAFGDVGFTLAVGAIGIADYDTKTSPFGFHIIKRVK